MGLESPAVPPHPAVLVTLPHSEQRRARPAATSVTPWTAARPTENPHPPIRRRYRRTVRRRLALPARLQDDLDRATPPTRDRRLGGLPPDSRCSAPEPVNFETRPERGKRPSSHVPTGRRAFRSARILARGPRQICYYVRDGLDGLRSKREPQVGNPQSYRSGPFIRRCVEWLLRCRTPSKICVSRAQPIVRGSGKPCRPSIRTRLRSLIEYQRRRQWQTGFGLAHTSAATTAALAIGHRSGACAVGVSGVGQGDAVEPAAGTALPAGTRPVVLVNAFGTVAVDGALVDRGSYAVAELASGCGCCTLSAPMQESLLDHERPDTIPDRDHRPIRIGGVISPRRYRTDRAAVQVIHPRIRNHGMIEGFRFGHDAADAASAVAAPPLRVARVRSVEQVERALVPHHVRSHTVEIFRTTSIVDAAGCNRIGSSHS